MLSCVFEFRGTFSLGAYIVRPINISYDKFKNVGQIRGNQYLSSPALTQGNIRI